MIDLHTHTDGLRRPPDRRPTSSRQAWLAGIRVLAVTDHDTIGGLAEPRTAAAEFGLRLVDGVEVTAIERERDVHVLGYFVSQRHAVPARFSPTQRERGSHACARSARG